MLLVAANACTTTMLDDSSKTSGNFKEPCRKLIPHGSRGLSWSAATSERKETKNPPPPPPGCAQFSPRNFRNWILNSSSWTISEAFHFSAAHHFGLSRFCLPSDSWNLAHLSTTKRFPKLFGQKPLRPGQGPIAAIARSCSRFPEKQQNMKLVHLQKRQTTVKPL